MTHAEIAWNVAIGVFLLVVGAVSRPVFKRIWQRMNQPSPLTPQSRGQLTQTLATEEIALERLNYLSSRPRELYLYLFQLLFGALVFGFGGVLIYVAPLFFIHGQYVQPSHLFLFLLLMFADILSLFGLIEAGRMSEKKVQKLKDSARMRIEQIKKQLNPLE